MSNKQKKFILTFLILCLITLCSIAIWYQFNYSTTIINPPPASVPITEKTGEHSMEAHLVELQENPENLHSLIAVISEYMKNRQWSDALPLLQRATVLLPKDASILYMLAFTEAQVGMFTEAEKSFINYIALSGDPAGYLSLGVLYAQFLDKPILAKETFEKAIASPKATKEIKDEAKRQIEKLSAK